VGSLWRAAGGASDSVPLCLKSRHRGRHRDARKLEGYVQTDGYEVYDRACDGAKGVVHVGCFAQAPRRFYDPHQEQKKAGSAEEALATIARLYRVEKRRGMYKDPQEFAAERRRQVEPILAEFRSLLERSRQR
jgi:transposase